ncbi:DUF998 domain-containing protein [Lysobacter tyrosinilyticus]
MLATAITVIALSYLFVTLFVLAPRKAGYSHVRHTISEIGEAGARHQRFVAFALFLPVGLLLLAVAYLVRQTSPAVATLALCIAVGYIGAALFPCDPGSPLFGSTRQAFHNLAGAVEYAGGGFSLMAIARDFGQPFQLAGFIVLGTAIGLSVLPAGAGRGALQRIAEVCLFGSLALAAWKLGSVP